MSFASRTARLAGALTGLGLQPGARIGILALNSDRYLESFFGLPWGGFVFVPINTRLAPPEIVFWLADSGCSGLLIDDTFAPMLPNLLPQIPALRRIIHLGDGQTPDDYLSYEALINQAQPITDVGRNGEDLAGIFYTGGTTGRSKGRDAEPRQHPRQRPEHPARDADQRSHPIYSCGADVPSRRWGL